MKTIKKSCIIILSVCSVVMLVSANSFAKTTLTVGYLPILDHLTLLVSHAKDNASFKDIEIEPKMFKSWKEMMGALKAGKLDACYILSTLGMDLFNSGVDIKAILLGHRDGAAITVNKDSVIHSANDLKGKAIAIPDHISTHTALLDAYLRDGGLSLADVNTKVIAPPNMGKSMQKGRIDAFIVAEPFGAKAQLDGYGRTLVLSKDILENHVECIVAVKNQFLEENPSGIQEWVDSLIRAGKWIDQDKLENGSRETAKMVTQYLPHSEQTIINGLQNPPDLISFSDLNPVVADFQKIVDISLRAGILENVDLNSFINDVFYQQSSEQ